MGGDIADARGAVNNMQTINGRDMTAKRRLESSIHTMQAEVDGMLVAAKNAEEKQRRPWLMLLVLLTNLEQSKIMLLTWLVPRTLKTTSLENLKVVLLMLRMLL